MADSPSHTPPPPPDDAACVEPAAIPDDDGEVAELSAKLRIPEALVANLARIQSLFIASSKDKLLQFGRPDAVLHDMLYAVDTDLRVLYKERNVNERANTYSKLLLLLNDKEYVQFPASNLLKELRETVASRPDPELALPIAHTLESELRAIANVDLQRYRELVEHVSIRTATDGTRQLEIRFAKLVLDVFTTKRALTYLGKMNTDYSADFIIELDAHVPAAAPGQVTDVTEDMISACPIFSSVMARFVMDRLDGTTPSSAWSKIEWKLHTNNVHSSRVRGEARQLFTLSFLDQNAASYKDWHRRHYLVQLSGRFQFRLDKDTTKWPASFNAGLGVPPEYPIKWSDDTAALPEATKEALSNWARHTNLLIEEAVQEYSDIQIRGMFSAWQLEQGLLPQMSKYAPPALYRGNEKRLHCGLAPDNVVTILVPEHLHDDTKRVWDTLVAKNPYACRALRYITILLALKHFSPIHLLQCLDVKGVKTIHHHADATEKQDCAERFTCALDGVAFACTDVWDHAEKLCPPCLQLYNGERGISPVHHRIMCILIERSEPEYVNATKLQRPALRARFYDELVEREGFDDGAVIISIPMVQHEDARQIAITAMASIKNATALAPYCITRRKNGTEYALEQLFRVGEDFATTLPDIASVRKAQAFKNFFDGSVTYDDVAVPYDMRSSVDQFRIMRPTQTGLATGHANDAVCIIPLTLQTLKGTLGPEAVDRYRLLRHYAACLLPIVDDVDDLLASGIKKHEKKLEDLGSAIRDLDLATPHTNFRREQVLQDAGLRNQIITLYKPIVAFGRELGRVDAFYGFIETAEPLQDAASAPPGRVGTFKPYFTASEIEDPEDVAAAIICEGTERDAPYGDKPEYLHQATEIRTSYKSIFDTFLGIWPLARTFAYLFGGWTLLGPMFIADKIWHYWLIIWWCDEFGRWWIAFIFITFIIINCHHICEGKGRCEYFGERMTLRRRDMAALCDCHIVHGVSMVYKSQLCAEVDMLSQIRIAFSNVKPTSRAWNRFRMAWRKDVLKRADTNMFEEGLALFKVYEPALAGLLAHNKAYPAQLQAVRDSPEIWGLTDAANANHIADLPRTHIFHPDQKETRYTYI